MESCASCRFCHPLTPVSGECRRHAPALPADPPPGHPGRFGVFPLVVAGGWCGEYRPRQGERGP